MLFRFDLRTKLNVKVSTKAFLKLKKGEMFRFTILRFGEIILYPPKLKGVETTSKYKRQKTKQLKRIKIRVLFPYSYINSTYKNI